QLRFAFRFGWNVRLREVHVRHIYLAIDRVHGPGNFGAFEILLLEIDSVTLGLPEARTIEYSRCPQIVSGVEKAQVHRELRFGRLANLASPTEKKIAVVGTHQRILVWVV